jgi:hypothetical protein
MKKSRLRELRALLADLGEWDVRQLGKHIRLTHRETGAAITAASTLSDRRGDLNLRSCAKRKVDQCRSS